MFSAGNTGNGSDWDRQLDSLVALVRGAVGAETVGSYLFGSAVLGVLLADYGELRLPRQASVNGVPLTNGAPPAGSVGPVRHAELVSTMVGVLDVVLDGLDSSTSDVMLTLARIWSTAASGQIRSEDAAAEWALERLPAEHRAVLARARAVYRGQEKEQWEDLQPRVRSDADYIVAQIRRLNGSGPASRHSRT